nr:hypothetical protein [Tanacetum cinerariifolium]
MHIRNDPSFFLTNMTGAPQVSGFMTNGLDMGVSPCQSNRVKSACSKLDLVFSSAVADVKDRLHSFTSLGKTSNSFGTFER